jgi:hypothetical protein
MNDTKWISGTDGDEMLDYVADRLTPRQWTLISAAHVRKLWDLLPEGPLRDAVNALELADKPLSVKERAAWSKKITAAIPGAIAAAQQAQREIVKTADPDSADLDMPVLDRPTQAAPAFPLFRAASNHARQSIERIGEAMKQSAEAVSRLFAEPNEEMLDLVREAANQAADTRVRANQFAADCIRLKQEGDETADRATVKTSRLEESKALEFVRRIEEGRNQSAGDWSEEEKREKAARKQLARVLREVVGNPFKPPRFEEAWRTTTAVDVAKSIFAERAFDRLPVLADALLDVDCDEEQILRHCRGTEIGLKEPVQHIRGCWVIELVLNRWSPVPPPAPGSKPRTRRKLADEFDLGFPPDDDDETGLA